MRSFSMRCNHFGKAYGRNTNLIAHRKRDTRWPYAYRRWRQSSEISHEQSSRTFLLDSYRSPPPMELARTWPECRERNAWALSSWHLPIRDPSEIFFHTIPNTTTCTSAL